MPTRFSTRCLMPLLLAIALPAQAHLQPYRQHREVYGLFSAGFTGGGEDLVKLRFERGGSENVEAGGEIVFGGGVIFAPRDSVLQYQFTLNYHSDGALAENGEVSFDRFPLEALLFFAEGRHRAGFGLSYHLSPELEIDIDGSPRETVDFEDALGIVVEYNFEISPQFLLGLRYTDIDYEVDGSPSTSVDGNHAGLLFYIRF